jgi:phage terminase Nu1 subunit (DNA packaging protein)
MTTEPNKKEYTNTEFADLCGVTRQNIFLKIKDGKLFHNKRGKVDLRIKANLEYWRNHETRAENSKQQKPSSENPDPSNADSLDSLRKENLRLKNESEKLKNQARRGEVVETEDVKRLFARMYTIDQTGFLNMAEKIAPELMAIAGMTDESKEVEFRSAIEKAVYVVLDQSARELEKTVKEWDDRI